MKHRIVLFILLATTLTTLGCKNATKEPGPTVEVKPAEISWYDLTEARDLATKQGKDIFLFVHAPWCPKCEAFKSGVFIDEELINILDTHFIPVMLNAQESKDITWEGEVFSNPNYDASKAFEEPNSYHELIYKLGAESIPNILVLDQSLNNIGSLLGLHDADRLKWYLSNTTGRYYYKLGAK